MKKSINAREIVVLVTVILVAFLVLYMVFFVNNNKVKNNSSYRKIQYNMIVAGIPMVYTKALQVGDNIYYEDSNICMGKIKKIVINPHLVEEIDYRDNLILVEKIGYSNVVLTIEGNIEEKDTGYHFSEDLELKVNSRYNIETKYIAITGIICDSNYNFY